MISDVSRMVFRCDGSFETGLGHLARCAVLAGGLPGVESKFITGSDPVAVDFLRRAEIDYRVVPVTASEREEASLVAEIARKLGARHVVVDKKDNSRAYLEILKQAGLLVIDIEDRGEGRLLADILIDPHIRPESREALSAVSDPTGCCSIRSMHSSGAAAAGRKKTRSRPLDSRSQYPAVAAIRPG